MKETKEKKKYYKPVKEIYKELREATKLKPKEGIFSEDLEEALKQELFDLPEEKIEEPSTEFEHIPEPAKKKDGLWDYVLEDEIDFFDPKCSYELTGFRPIDEENGLDFDPEVFREAANAYDTTGCYTKFPAGSKPYADYWREQFKRCTEGYTVGKYRVTGDHYFFLNFYRMQTVMEGRTAGKGRDESFPGFLAKQYEFFHYVEMAEKLHKDVAILKARGIGLSEIVASLAVRPYTTNRGYRSLLTAADSTKLNPLKAKVWKQMNWLDMNTGGGMRHLRQKVNNDDKKRASQVSSDGIEFGWRSEVEAVVADTSDKIRGDRVDRLIFEECFGKGTRVIMADYSRKNIEDIKVGDFVMGVDGSPQEVIKTNRGTDQLYLIKQLKGEDYIVNANHPLYLDYRPRNNGWKDQKVLVTVPELLGMHFKKAQHHFSVKSGSHTYYNNELWIDPYFYGLWLGDGFHQWAGLIINCSCDPEIENFIKEYFGSLVDGRDHIYIRPGARSENCIMKEYMMFGRGCKGSRLFNWMKANNLIKNKHILKEVMTCSEEYRLKILAGFIDSDGNLQERVYKDKASYSYKISQSRKYLIEQLSDLVRSCGLYCSVKVKDHVSKTTFGPNTIMYDLYISGDIGKIPVKVERKKVPNTYKSKRNVLSSGIRIEDYGIGEYYGITLRSYGKDIDNLFLLNDYTIVHNCGSNKHLAKSWIQGNALVELGGEHFGTRIALGTGGDDMALEGLTNLFSTPEAYNVFPYKNYDTEDDKPILSAFFIPAHKFSLKAEYLDNRGVTDSKRFRAFYEEQRKKFSGNDLMDYCAEHCFFHTEALFKQGDNMFDSVSIADRLGQLRIQKIGVKPQQVKMYWDHPNEATNPRQKVKLVEDTANGKIFIYEPPKRDPDGNVYKNLYVAGIDAIDQGGNDSSGQKDVSDFCIVIKRRTFGSELPNYVAIYKDRPRDIVEAYENAMKLLVYYNCKAMLEHTKIGIIMYFRSKKKESLFMTRPKSTMSDIRRGNSNMLGVPATEIILKHGLELINQFLMECVYNVNIDSMLEQLLKYSWENKRKFDIVSAMIVAEIGDEDLMGFAPRVQNEVQKQWRDFGWYTDSYGVKRYGILPENYGNRGENQRVIGMYSRS